MYRYDLQFRNAKTGAVNWIVGFGTMEAARAYADRLRDARQDDSIVCTLYGRTIEGDFHRYTGDGFRAEPRPEGVKYRYIVVSEDGSVGQAFEDRQAAQDFMDSHPGLLLRLHAQRADGFAAPPQNPSSAKAAGQGASKPDNGLAANQRPSKQGDQAKPDARPQGQKGAGDPKSGRSRFSPFLAGAAGAGIGAFAANAVFANSAGEGAAADPLAAEGFPSEGVPFGDEGFSAAGIGEGSAFAGEGFAGAGIGESGAFLGEGFSAAGLGGSAITADGLADAGLGGGEPLVNDIAPCDGGSMIAGATPGEDIAGMEEGFPTEDIAGVGDDEGGFFGTIASLFSDD
ncbi:hypothetical protein [Thioalkalivibrio sp. HK1]|uniref:hypothetical protein n=1 Tax=Thioalkalivibrio sp. HK1 TaxID=1469245 RepID=UPI0004717DF1|nr:hypothetical protein [Thioalkalivibrio sp. HK1]